MPFRFIDTRCPEDLFRLSSRLEDAPFHRPSVETVILPRWDLWDSITGYYIDLNLIGRVERVTSDMLSCLPRVREISIPYRNIEVLEKMPKHLKLRLRILHLSVCGGPFHRRVLSQFTNLTSLIFSNFSCGVGPVHPGSTNGICFPSVKFIKINDRDNFGTLRLLEACEWAFHQTSSCLVFSN